jgi:hypothetical protein
MVGWFRLGEDSRVPHQLDLDGLVDLDDLVVALSQGIALVLYPTAAALSRNPRAARMDGSKDGWMDGYVSVSCVCCTATTLADAGCFPR